MKKKQLKIPKQRNEFAKALSHPLFKPKVTPSKKGKIRKMENKHKGKGHSSFPFFVSEYLK